MRLYLVDQHAIQNIVAVPRLADSATRRPSRRIKRLMTPAERRKPRISLKSCLKCQSLKCRRARYRATFLMACARLPRFGAERRRNGAHKRLGLVHHPDIIRLRTIPLRKRKLRTMQQTARFAAKNASYLVYRHPYMR